MAQNFIHYYDVTANSLLSGFAPTGGTGLTAVSPWDAALPVTKFIAGSVLNSEARWQVGPNPGDIPSDAVISNVQLMANFVSTGAINRWKFTAGGTAVGSAQSQTSQSTANSASALATNPATGVAWTLAEVFSTDFGLKITVQDGTNVITVYRFQVVVQFRSASITVTPNEVSPGGGDHVEIAYASGNGRFGPPTGGTDGAGTGTYVLVSPTFALAAGITIITPARLTFIAPAGAVASAPTMTAKTYTQPTTTPTLRAQLVMSSPDAFDYVDGVWWFWEAPPFISGIDIGPFYWFGVAPPPFPGWDVEDAVAPSPDGWWMSVAAFGGSTLIIANGRPKNPRTWDQISGFATGSAAWLGGSPGIAAIFQNRMVYAASDYTVGTTYPPIRIYDGSFDRELCRLPPTAAGAIPKAIVSMLVANGTIYVATWDSGTTSADWVGRVFSLELTTATLTPIGAAFTTGHLPYALAWHNGMLWAGTHRQATSAAGAIFRIRPGIDDAWTQDVALTGGQTGVASLLSWRGTLYAGLTAPAGTFAKIVPRAAAGTWATTADTGSGGTATANNGYLSMAVFNDALYASYWNADTPAVATIRKTTDGTTWTTVYTGAAGTLRPFIVLYVDNGELFAIGGDVHLTAAVVRTDDGTTWTDLTAELPDTDKTALPAVGVLVF